MNTKRFMIAAPKSGSGKTIITCGLIRAMKDRGLAVAAIKCGPDYIDPMFHRTALGVSSGNADTFFTDEKTTRELVASHGRNKDVVLLEGVMGYYDGLGGTTERGSSYEIARVTETPVVLVVDAKGASLTLAATIKGIIDFEADSNIKGIILNKASASYYPRLKSVIEEKTGIEVIGFVTESKELAIASRHLGLVSPDEVVDIEGLIKEIADIVSANVDIDKLLKIAKEAGELSDEALKPVKQLSKEIRIAVAKDEAFSFYYQENLALLKKMGAKIIEFSPLRDKTLPENIQTIFLGGGYPELYADRLSENESMRSSIRGMINKGVAVIAECGGFMYLMESMEDDKKDVYPMVGAIKGHAYKTDRLCRFGYIELKLDGRYMLRAHEFHRWDTDNNGTDVLAKKPITGAEYECMHVSKRMLAGYPHLYYYSNVDFIYDFLEGIAADV